MSATRRPGEAAPMPHGMTRTQLRAVERRLDDIAALDRLMRQPGLMTDPTDTDHTEGTR